jgi:hypothetical protein
MKTDCRLIAFLIIVITASSIFCLAAPVGPSSVSYVKNSTRGISGAFSRGIDQRGTITTVVINVTQQTLYWKAYVGNVSGKITLDDDYNYTIYDWLLTSTGGEVYATRKSTTVNWLMIECANHTVTEAEQNAINHITEKTDSLNRTFGRNNHPGFYSGNASFPSNTCNKTIHTYVNDAPQTASFSEVLLYDPAGYVVYAAILNNSVFGYDNGTYDFQMLVGEKGLEGTQTPLTYYFYVELT